MAYVRPKVDNHRAWFKISRIGSANARLIGDSRDAVPMGQFLATIVLTLGGAATVLLVVAARCGSATRDRRAQLLAALGGSARHRALINLGEGLVPALIGMALGSAPYLVMMTMSIRLPVTGYITNPADLRAWSWAIPLVATGACTVVLLAVIGLHRVTMDGGSTRPRTFGARIPSWRLAAGVIGLVSIIITPYLPKVASFFGYIGGTALLWGMLPSAAGVLIRRLGASAAAFGAWAGHAAALVAGRWAQARPGVIVRLVAVVVIGLGVITQAQVWTSRLGDSTQNAQRMRQQIQDSVLIVSSSSMTRTGIDNFANLLPNKSSLVAVISAPESERTPELRASCPTIRDLGLVCSPAPAHLGEGDARARALNGSIGFMTGQTNLREGNTSSNGNVPTVLAVISPLDSHNLAWRVKKAAHQSLGKARVERPYDSWILGADRLVQMAEWVKLLTAVVLGILFLCVVYSSAAEFLVFTSALAPLAVLSEQRRFLVGIAVWNLTLPTVLATAIGAGVAAWQGMFFVGMSQSGVFSWTTLEVSSIVALTLAVGLGVTGGLGAVGAASRWRPAAD
ncbi:hypothetical protein [Streptosporangium sp. NPDC006007]|uniref:hypothetical protein n=1 Tax=Streptosporangium sp. NPDC006007 TaxID=3154575 RepID=UPI0033B27DC9